ncbi:MAG: hypothetical protein WA840_14305 [Caulobacteraceae bacterium]
MFSRIGIAGFAAFCAASALSSASLAQTRLQDGASLAHLEQALDKPASKIIDGRIWECDGDTCHADQQGVADSRPLTYECENVAKSFGRFKDYQTGSDVLKPSQLNTCNASVKPSLHAGP